MKPKKMIPVTGPSITATEVAWISRAAKDGWNKNALKYVNLFEERFAAYVGRKYAHATSSCTGALHLAYLALGIKKGDEVIVPNITWAATAEPLYYMGAKVVFADIERDTWCIDPKDIERKITKKTKAIVVVDMYGHIPDMDAIMSIAKRHNLKVVEDAAEAVGAEYHRRMGGSFGDVSVFSFHGSKTLVTGEGGMLLSDDKKIVDKARWYNDHCKDPKKLFWNLEIGYRYKMSNLQAACGLGQLSRVRELVAKKRKIFSWYEKRLHGIPGITLNAERPRTKNGYWMVTAVFDKKYNVIKEDLVRTLAAENIQARPFFYPMSSLPAMRTADKTPVAFDISPRAINLPCGQSLTEQEVDYVCKTLLKVIGAR